MATIRSTLKDIATRAGVSIVTVHKAIYDKPGISEETRQKVLRIVAELDYSVNAVASSLKRDVLKIAVIFPLLENNLNYFFRKVGEGIAEVERELLDFRVSILSYPCDKTWQNQAEILEIILAREDVDGVVIYCWDDTKLNPYFLRLQEKGIPVVTFNSDAVNSCRIGCVTAPNERTGRLAAEFLCQIVPPGGGRIMVLGGNRMMKNLREITFGFFSYVQKHRPDLTVMEINDFGTLEDLSAEMERAFAAFGDLYGVYCNSARNSIPLCEALKKTGLAGRIKAVASDVFEELAPYLDEGVIQATMWQDPKSQSKKAVEMLYEYLTNQRTPSDTYTVGIGIVMSNNFVDYL